MYTLQPAEYRLLLLSGIDLDTYLSLPILSTLVLQNIYRNQISLIFNYMYKMYYLLAYIVIRYKKGDGNLAREEKMSPACI